MTDAQPYFTPYPCCKDCDPRGCQTPDDHWTPCPEGCDDGE